MKTLGTEKIMGTVVMKDGEVKSFETLDTERAMRREQYNNIMSNINPLMMVGKGKDRKMVTATATVPLSLCFVDHRYQGMRAHKNLNKLINHWDVRKLSPIVVVPHPEEYRWAIADGQGRFLVAPMKGMDRLTATILMDAPEDPDERLKFEAEYFIGQDTEVENVRDYEKHPARVLIGDDAAVTLEKILKKYGVRFVSTRGSRRESVLGSYKDTYAIAKNHGEKCLDFIFSIVENAGWNKESNGYATFVMKSLKESWVAHPEDRDAIHKYLSTNLRYMDPALFSARAKVRYPNRDSRINCVLFMEDMVCDGLSIEKKIYADGAHKCKVI